MSELDLTEVKETTSMLPPPTSTGISLDPPQPPPSKAESRVVCALNLSWWVNLVLLFVKAFAFAFSGSKSILASLIDSCVDIVSQSLVTLAMRVLKKPNKSFPIGRARLEAISVVCCACIMLAAAVFVIIDCCETLAEGWGEGKLATIDFGAWPIALLVGTTVLKIVLYAYCYPLQKLSDAMKAITEDHLNDVMSNSMALAAALITVYVPNNQAWWVDPLGGALISLWIIARWLQMVKEQVEKLVGKSAPKEFIEQVEKLVNDHALQLKQGDQLTADENMELDVVRVYYSGARFVVEVEVVLPWHMNLLKSHDICLSLQHKIEVLEEVERCHVHADYMKRDAPEHKPEREAGFKHQRIDEVNPDLRQRQNAAQGA